MKTVCQCPTSCQKGHRPKLCINMVIDRSEKGVQSTIRRRGRAVPFDHSLEIDPPSPVQVLSSFPHLCQAGISVPCLCRQCDNADARTCPCDAVSWSQAPELCLWVHDCELPHATGARSSVTYRPKECPNHEKGTCGAAAKKDSEF